MSRRRAPPRERPPIIGRFWPGPVTVDPRLAELGITPGIVRGMIERHTSRDTTSYYKSIGELGNPVSVDTFRRGKPEKRAYEKALREVGIVRTFFATPDRTAPHRLYLQIVVETDLRGPRTRVVLVSRFPPHRGNPRRKASPRRANPRRFGRGRFGISELIMTRGAIALFSRSMSSLGLKNIMGRKVRGPSKLLALLDRHTRADWGDNVDNDDRRLNDATLRAWDDALPFDLPDGRVLSAFWVRTEHGRKEQVWIITETVGPDRMRTTVLTPDEY